MGQCISVDPFREMKPHKCFGWRNANLEEELATTPLPSGITPVSGAEAVVTIATGMQDHKPAVVAERPDHDPEIRGLRLGLVVERR